MADIKPEFDVEKDSPEFLSSVLDRSEECIHNSETDINDLQAQSVVLDRTVSLLSSNVSVFPVLRISYLRREIDEGRTARVLR